MGTHWTVNQIGETYYWMAFSTPVTFTAEADSMDRGRSVQPVTGVTIEAYALDLFHPHPVQSDR